MEITKKENMGWEFVSIKDLPACSQIIFTMIAIDFLYESTTSI